MRVGRPREMPRPEWDRHSNRTWKSAYVKDEVLGKVAVGTTGLEGDQQYDRRVHGGPTMAVLSYAASHYPRWRDELGIAEMGPGGFGENLAIDGLDERSVCLGDVLEAGTTRLCVTQPRGPCANIGRRWNHPDLLAIVTANHRTGWYLAVPQPGTIAIGDSIAVIERPCPDWNIERVLRARLDPKSDPAAIPFLARCAELSEGWRAKFAQIEQRLASSTR